MPTRITRVPEVLDTLLELIRGHPDIDEAAVLDGARVSNDFRAYLIIVGFRPNAEADIDSERRAPRGLVSNDDETLTIGLLVSGYDGNGVMKTARDVAFAKLAVVHGIVTGNPRLGLSGVKATIRSGGWQQMPSGKGVEVNVRADITVDTLL